MALTWQNVSPSNPASILQAGNMAAANIAKGLDVVGSSMQEYAKDTTDAETGKLLLMLDNAKDRNERQAILDNTDMDYIDQDIIAKDNQGFVAREQQREDILFKQGKLTEAAAEEKAQNTFERNIALEAKKQRGISDAAEEAQRQWQRKTTEEKKALELGYRTADVEQKNIAAKKLENYQAKMLAAAELAEKNRETKRSEDRLAKIAEKEATTAFRQGIITREEHRAELAKIAEKRDLALDIQQSKIFGLQLKDQERNEQNIAAGKDLVEKHPDAFKIASESITGLKDYFTTMENHENAGIKAAGNLKKIAATAFYKKINRFDVFGEGVKISEKLKDVTEGTIEQNKKNHADNVKVFSDELRKTLIGKIDEGQLKSMSERMLNNVIIDEEKDSTYGHITSNLNKTKDDLQQDKIDIVKDMLFNAVKADKIIDQTEYTAIENYIKTESNFNKDTSPVQANLLTILDTAVTEQFKNEQILDPSSTKYVSALKKGAMDTGGILSKKTIIANHADLVIELTHDEMARAKSFGINKEKVKAKIEEQLNNIPGYASILAGAGKSYAADIEEKKNRAILQLPNKVKNAKTLDELSAVVEFAELNEINDKLPGTVANRLRKFAVEDPKFIDENLESNADTFTIAGYREWVRKRTSEITTKHKHINDNVVKEIFTTVLNRNPKYKKALESYQAAEAYAKKLQEGSDVASITTKITDQQFGLKFKANPVKILTEHVLSSPHMAMVLKSLGNDSSDLGDTLTDARKLINHVYGILERQNTDEKPKQLFERSMRALTHFVQKNESIGEEYTLPSLPSKNEVVEAAKGRGEISVDLTGPALQKQIAALKIQINRFNHPGKRNSPERAALVEELARLEALQ